MLETLEHRQLMSGTTASLNAAGVLSVTGTSASQGILLKTDASGQWLNVYAGTGDTAWGKGSFQVSKLKRVEVHAGAGDDLIRIDNAIAAPVLLYGDSGNDTLLGGKSADYLFGGEGNDDLDGGFGDDFIWGDGGHDVIRDSKDMEDRGSGTDHVWGGSGTDRIDYGQRRWTGVTIRLDGSATSGRDGEKDQLYDDIERATGTNYDDVIVGNARANVLHGGSGRDTIYGGAGDDNLFGDAGHDFITGGAGQDWMVGGKGSDSFYAQDFKGGDTVWAGDIGVYAISTVDYDTAFVDKGLGDITYGTNKNYGL